MGMFSSGRTNLLPPHEQKGLLLAPLHRRSLARRAAIVARFFVDVFRPSQLAGGGATRA